MNEKKDLKKTFFFLCVRFPFISFNFGTDHIAKLEAINYDY